MRNLKKLFAALAAGGLLLGGAAHAKSTRASDQAFFGASHGFDDSKNYGWKDFSHFIKWRNHRLAPHYPPGLLRKIRYLIRHFGDSPGG